MYVAACIASHDSVAEECVPQQCRYRRLGLESADLSATAIALEYNDEPIIRTTGKQ